MLAAFVAGLMVAGIPLSYMLERSYKARHEWMRRANDDLDRAIELIARLLARLSHD